MKFIRWLVETRSRKYRGCYILCAAITTSLGFLGVGMEGGLIVALPYVFVASLCILQFFRPMVILRFLLTVTFGVATTATAMSFQKPVNEFVIFLSMWGIPAVLLLWSWPRPVSAAGA